MEREGIRLERHDLPRARLDLVLVERARLQTRDEQLPYAALVAKPHGVAAPIPVVEGPYDAHASRVGRPHRERDAANALELARMRAEPLVGAKIPAFGEQTDVPLAEQRREAVGILDLPFAVRRHQTQAVGEPVSVPHDTLEESVPMQPGELGHGRVRARVDHRDAGRTRQKGAHHDGTVGRGPVHAQYGERIALVGADDGREIRSLGGSLVRRCHAFDPISSRTPATGARTQSGRLAAS